MTHQSTSSPDRLLTEREIAQYTARSVATVRRDRLYRRGVPYLKIGSSVRYRISDLHRWLDSLPVHGGPR